MNYNKINKKHIAGGLDGIVSIVCDYIKCGDKPFIKKQILKSDEIAIKGLENFSVMELADVIRYMAMGILNDGCDSDYITNNLVGDIQLFGGGETNLEKSQTFITNSNLEDEEKETMLDYLIESNFTFSLHEIFVDIFIENYPEYFKIISFVKNFSLEKEYRLSELKIILDELNKAIDKNEELLKPKIPNHIRKCAKFANNSYRTCLTEINKNLSQYVNLLGNKLYGIDVKPNHRRDTIIKLCDPSKINIFSDYEQRLATKDFISNDFTSWNKEPIDFITFYRFCEENDVFSERHKTKSSGVKLLRELYNYNYGTSLDAPNKRKSKVKTSDIKTKYYFL